MENTKTKHTPGPWEYVKTTVQETGQRERINRIVIGTPRNKNGGRFVAAEIIGPWCGEEERHEADARLISAAPDLLAALEKTLKIVIRCGTETGPGDTTALAIESARAAIAKAKGE